MKITKLDLTKNIVSGTFWYDIKDCIGIVHKIREGRFDMQFTQLLLSPNNYILKIKTSQEINIYFTMYLNVFN